jgi:hypothetical protein
MEAQKAVMERIKEKTLADPEGVILLNQIEALDAKIREMMPKRAHKPRRERGAGKKKKVKQDQPQGAEGWQ